MTKADGGIRIGRESVPAIGLQASIVEAEVGVSVAFIWDKGELFVETSTLEDAQTLVSLSQAEPAETLTLRTPVPTSLRLLKIGAAFFGAVACVILATTRYEGNIFTSLVICGLLASACHIFESILRRRVPLNAGSAGNLARGSIKEHVILHLDRHTIEREPRLRVRVLARGAEPTREWLGRLDGIAGDAYRGELPLQEDLRQVLADRTSALHDRLGAARLLVRRYNASIGEIEAALEPELVPYVLDIGHEDVEHASASLDRLGPLFHATKG